MMGDSGVDVDVLLIAHKRADYLALSLPRLLDSLPEGARAWVWQNGSHPATGEVIATHRTHPRFYRFHHSPQNLRLALPTNSFWSEARGRLLGKVDDDCLVPDGWVQEFASAHDHSSLGIIAAWHFPPEDLLTETVAHRSVPIGEHHRLIQNCWVGGTGYLMKAACTRGNGRLDERRSFTSFCVDASSHGWQVGWHYPLVLQDHMDDPRSPNTRIRTDEDLLERAPLSAKRLAEPTVGAWEAQLRRDAVTVQTASLRPRDHRGWRRRFTRLRQGIGP